MNRKIFSLLLFASMGRLAAAQPCNYTCEGAAGQNMVANPGFESGNTGFTSDYVFATSAADGNYGLTTNAYLYAYNLWCNAWDHTTGSGTYLWADGASTKKAIWRETFSVAPLTQYSFSFWGMNLARPYGGVYEYVDVYINNVLVSGNIDLNAADCFWVQNCMLWDSQNSTSATVEIRNAYVHYIGNDMAFDDIEFVMCRTPLGVGEPGISSLGVNVFPNPASSELSIDFGSNDLGKAEVSFTNMIGQEIFHTTIPASGTQVIDLPDMEEGIYFVKISTEAGNVTKKIVITK